MRAGSGQRTETLVLMAPVVLYLVAFCVVPLAILFAFSFYRVDFVDIIRDPSFDNYWRVFGSETYRGLILKAMGHGALVAALAAVIAYPVAVFIAYHVGAMKAALLTAMLIPLYTGDLIRIFAWRVVLGAEGILNSFLLWIGVIDEPIWALLFSPFATTLVLVYNYLPFMVLALWVAMEFTDRRLLEAAADLGAPPLQRFRHVILPLSLPGLMVGSLMVFALVIGDYLTPQLVGGSSGVTIISAIHDLFGAAFDWPLGSAIAWSLLAVLLLVVGAVVRLLAGFRLGRTLFARKP